MSEPLAVREAPARYQVVPETQRVRPGYKQTEVGVIPEDWEAKSLKEIGNPVRGGSPRPAGDSRFFNGSYIPWLTVAALTNIPTSQLVVTETATLLTEEGSLYSRILQPGTLIIANSGATLGVSKILGIKCCANDGIAALLNIRKDVSAEYLAHFINTKTTYLRDVVATGNGQPNLNTELIGRFNIPLPPTKAEQEAIAEALSDADALIEALEQLIVKKRQLKQGAMQELLTGKKRLPGFSGEWDVRTIEQLEKARLLQLSRGNVISKVDIECVPGDFPIYSSSVKSDGVFGNYGEYMFDEELITWSIDGGGHFFHRPRHKFSVTNVCGYMRADTSKLSYQFLAAQLQLLHSRLKFDYQDKAHPSVIRKAYSVSIPTLDEQTAIATILSDMNTEIAVLETRLAKTRALKQGMMHNLLTGKVRLV